MKNLIKILTVILLGLSLTGCELFDPREWQKATEYRRERGMNAVMEMFVVRIKMEMTQRMECKKILKGMLLRNICAGQRNSIISIIYLKKKVKN